MESNPHYPFNLMSKWLPHPESQAIKSFLKTVGEGDTPSQQYAPSIKSLDEAITNDAILSYLVKKACQEDNLQRPQMNDKNNVHQIKGKDDLIKKLNVILKMPPKYYEDYELVGLPFTALLNGLTATLSGVKLFGLPIFNQKIGEVLEAWNMYLNDENDDSNSGFAQEGEQWLSSQAKQKYDFKLWKTDYEKTPYWKTWNSFFTRSFKNKDLLRPIDGPYDGRVVTSPNDGTLFRWDENINSENVFWFKDMTYSLTDIFSSADPIQQKIMDDFGLVELFTEGSIFQTFLSPDNYHRWWSPASGKVIFPPFVIKGAYFSKLVIPDFEGVTTNSLPYLAHVNCRGIFMVKTEDYGYICCIPIGMVEVSTVKFNEPLDAVTKGDEIGMFQYGGSTFLTIYQKLPGKRLMFQDSFGNRYDKRPEIPKGLKDIENTFATDGGHITLVGSQIGKWEDVDFKVQATARWQAAGYVNEGKTYEIKYRGGLWTASTKENDGNLYGADGINVDADSRGYPVPDANKGALVGRIGGNKPFLVYKITRTPSGQTGQLYFTINADFKLMDAATKNKHFNKGAVIISIK